MRRHPEDDVLKTMLNIIIRTSGRPRYFEECIRSIRMQSHPHVNVIVGTDGVDSYADEFNPIRYPRLSPSLPPLRMRMAAARHFPFNLYLNRLMQECVEGWVMILDDDDRFVSETAVVDILSHCKSPVDAPFWRVRIRDRMVPSDEHFGDRPVCKDISMIGFAFHSAFIPILQFDSYKQADYRVADRIYSVLNPIWIDKVLTQSMRTDDAPSGSRGDR